MKSWKTSLGGFIGAIGLALKHQPSLAVYSDTVIALGILITGLAARDNGVTSEDAGAKKPDGK